jgi:hypothetical protein
MCSSLTDPSESSSGVFQLGSSSTSALSVSRSVWPITLRSCCVTGCLRPLWASKALAGVLAWSKLQRQHFPYQMPPSEVFHVL